LTSKLYTLKFHSKNLPVVKNNQPGLDKLSKTIAFAEKRYMAEKLAWFMY